MERSEGKRLYGRPRLRFEDNMKIDNQHHFTDGLCKRREIHSIIILLAIIG
jgi:hypothetical protein